MTKTNTQAADPLALFAASPQEKEGVWADIENPNTGEVLMRWKLARFGGQNNTEIVRVERKLKGKLTQGQRRAIDAGEGDPEVVARMNRQVFVRVSCLDWEMVNEALKERYGSFTHESADQVLEQYPGIYDSLSEQAMKEENYSVALLGEQLGN